MSDAIDEEARRRGVSREALLAFYRQRSDSLRNSHTTGWDTKPQAPPKRRQPALSQPAPARSGILGYVADRVTGALQGQ